MRRTLVTLAFVLMAPGLTAVAVGDEKPKEKAHKHTVVVPQDNAPFTVKETDVVRITGSVIAGGTIKETHTGPVHLAAENTITKVKGGHVVLGQSVKEFDYKPSGKGKVKVTITTKVPMPGVSPIQKVYEFEVK